MANYNCDSCESIRQTDPNLIVNGLGDTECASLSNNTGLNPSSGNNDFTDLSNLNDCLVGNQATEVEAYDVCDWKTFMKQFIPNVWTTLKGIICAIGGLWTNVTKLECQVSHLATTTGGVIHAYEDDDPSKPAINGFKIAQGVEVVPAGSANWVAPMSIITIGSIARVSGTIKFTGNMPTSYTNGQTVAWTDFYDSDRGGTNVTNQAGHSSKYGCTPDGGFLLYQYEVDPCDYGFDRIYQSSLLPSTVGDFRCRVLGVRKGDYYPYDWGVDTTQSGNVNGQQQYNPSDENKMLIQVRLEEMHTWQGNGMSPTGVVMVRPCADSWEC